jgi:hypothetical protein
MDPTALLELFDREMRIDPPVAAPYRLDNSGGLVRIRGPGDVCVVFGRTRRPEI